MDLAAYSESARRVIAGTLAVTALDDDTLVSTVIQLNRDYRANSAVVSDQRYDHEFLAEMRTRLPEHPFLQVPEPEPADAFGGERYRHSVAMLSTDKAYDSVDVQAWVTRVTAAAESLGIDPATVRVRVMPKIDGIAARRYPDALVTRGENGWGNDISRLLQIGVIPTSDEMDVSGEVAIVQKYFDEEIAGAFDLKHPRNFMTGLAGAETMKDHHRKALQAGVCHFVVYPKLPHALVPLLEFRQQWDLVMDEVQQLVPYLCDGAVAQVEDDEQGARIREAMGASSRAHRWMLALKRNAITAETMVLAVVLGTGRTGQVTPRLELAPVKLYGVTISSVTAHTVAALAESGIGPGARIQITRAGGVVPQWLATLEKAEAVPDATRCPCCNSELEVEGKHSFCRNRAGCSAQSSAQVEHFFSTIGTANGFGPVMCDLLAEKGMTSIPAIYRLDLDGFRSLGVSDGIAKNLIVELARSRREPLSDAIFLGALGIKDLGRGDSRHLLAEVPLEDLGELTVERLLAIKGFGAITSPTIVAGIKQAWPMIQDLMSLGFNLERTTLKSSAPRIDSPISGKLVVFTGTMESGDRKEMEDHARRLGATVGGSVSGKTNLLVCGAKVGASKMEKARAAGVEIIDERAYLDLIGAPSAPAA